MDLPIHIDRGNPTPIYYQIKEQLALLIRDGRLEVNAQLPSEPELSEGLGISRGTVRQAIDALVGEGRLRRVHGVGTFVTEPPHTSLFITQRFTSFAEDMREMNVPFSTRVIAQRRVQAEGRLVTKLRVAPGENVLHLERLGYAEQQPFVISFTYIPEVLCPDLFEKNLNDHLLYDVLERDYGLRLARAERTLEASVADDYEATLLEIPVGSPIHFMHSLAYLDDGRPVEYSRLRFRGDKSHVHFEVRR
jgi:GntR family transcriptional regulator